MKIQMLQFLKGYFQKRKHIIQTAFNQPFNGHLTTLWYYQNLFVLFIFGGVCCVVVLHRDNGKELRSAKFHWFLIYCRLYHCHLIFHTIWDVWLLRSKFNQPFVSAAQSRHAGITHACHYLHAWRDFFRSSHLNQRKSHYLKSGVSEHAEEAPRWKIQKSLMSSLSLVMDRIKDPSDVLCAIPWFWIPAWESIAAKRWVPHS